MKASIWKSLLAVALLALGSAPALANEPVVENATKTAEKVKTKSGKGVSTAPVKGAKAGEPASKQKFLHFGNMGGLLPTLIPDDIPEPESQPAQWVMKYCSECHNPPGPGLHTAKEWETLVWRMYWRMVVMDANFKDFVLPTMGEIQSIMAYMKRFAMRSITHSNIDSTQPGASEFLKICGQCHQYPDPSAYKNIDWVFTVKRMKRHMETMNRVIPDTMGTEAILTFLRKQSGQ